MIKPGQPEGKIDGPPDSLYLDSAHAVLWVKNSPKGTKTGWKCIGQVVGSVPIHSTGSM
jgi:hypothetical protein